MKEVVQEPAAEYEQEIETIEEDPGSRCKDLRERGLSDTSGHSA